MSQIKNIIANIPFIGPITLSIYKSLKKETPFTSSNDYWKKRYESGGNSGVGSYDALAEFKAEVINEFLSQNNPKTVIEFGCGDGNQLQYLNYNSYTGFDISQVAVNKCREMYQNDLSKRFDLIQNFKNETADLTLSLDVIFHLIEDNVYQDYMERLFSSSNKFVIVYSSNDNLQHDEFASHVKHRKFSTWVEQNAPEFKLITHIPNKYPKAKDNTMFSYADFFIYQKEV